MAKEAVVPHIPDLGRKEVVERARGPQALDFNAYGRIRGALRLWDFFAGEKGGKFYKAEFVILSIQPDLGELALKTNQCVAIENGMQFLGSKDKSSKTLRIGDKAALLFPQQRGGTATDPGREHRDDANLADFVATLMKQKRGPAFGPEAQTEALKDLNRLKKFENDALQFDLIRRPDEVEKELKHPVTKEVLQKYVQVFARDSFEIVPA